MERRLLTWLDVVIAVCALWRVTSLFTDEPGPGDLFEKLRESVGIEHEDHKKVVIPDTYWARLLDCPYCFSMQVGIVCSVVWFISPSVARWLSLPYALSTGAIALAKLLDYEGAK